MAQNGFKRNKILRAEYRYQHYLFKQTESAEQGLSEFGSHSQAVMFDVFISYDFILPYGLFALIFTYRGGFYKSKKTD